MRRVRVFKYAHDETSHEWKNVFDCEAYFHKWTVDWEELSQGITHFPVAIVEKDDGTIEVVPARQIQFIDKEE
jgi:hypothetical protein